VLFDAVGTLIELREPVGESYARLARAHGAEVPAARLDAAFARLWREGGPMPGGADPAEERAWWRERVAATFREAAPGLRFAGFDACFDDLWRHFAGGGAWRRRPGSREILVELGRRGLARAVVSNFDRRLSCVLSELGLAPHLDALVLPGEAGAPKPDPRIFALALERLGVAAAQALYVGDDRELDLEAARRAGLRAIGVDGLAKLADLTRELA